MPAPPGISLTGPEVAQIRRDMLTLDHVLEELRSGRPVDVVLARIESVAGGVRFLLDRAEQRRGVH